ncbi:MAG: hypothetical protein ACE5GV_11600, partial [Candidatus Scalindua sp.]
MPEQSLNSLIGIQSTKELPATGIQKTGNSSLQTNQNNHSENSFLAKLTNSMNNESTIDNQDSTIIPSELNNISSIEEIYHLIVLASMDAPTNITTNIHNDQTPLYQILNHDIPVEVFTKSIINNTDTVQSNASLENLLPGLPSTSFTDKLNTSQISTKITEQNITDLLNKLNPAKIAGTTG